MNCLGKYIYIVEIQRYSVKKRNKEGKFEDSEENYRGLVFELENECDRDKWTRYIQSEVRIVKGVVQKLTGNCPGKAASFKHRLSRGDTISCEGALKNALDKMGIIFTAD